MTALPNFDRMVDDFARAAVRAPARRPRRWLGLAALGVAVGATGVAIAASGGGKVKVGHPVIAPARPGLLIGPDPNPAAQRIVPGSVHLLSARAADPDGGPPWGVRSMRTRSGVLCVQVGRVVDGRFGVLGFDRKLHELPARVDVSSACAAAQAAPRLAPYFERTGARVGGIGAAAPVSSVKLNGNGMSSERGCDGRVWKRIKGRPLVPCDLSRFRVLGWGVLEDDVRSLVVDGRTVVPNADLSYVFVQRANAARPSPVYARLGSGEKLKLVPRQSALRAPTGHLNPDAQRVAEARITPTTGGPNSVFALSWTVPYDARHRGDEWEYRLTGPGGSTCRSTLDTTIIEPARGIVRKNGELRPQGGPRKGQRLTRTFSAPGPQPNGWCPGDYSGEVRFDQKEVVATFAFSVR